MSQELEPENVFEILSRRLADQVKLVYLHGGYVDKYSGDGIMAVFDGEDMTRNCCRCALGILESAHDAGAMQLGLGIHQGYAMVGNLGSEDHLDYTVIGKTVNLAARLCGLARQSIIVSRAVRDAVAGDAAFRFSSERTAQVRGFRDPVTVFELQRTTTQGP